MDLKITPSGQTIVKPTALGPGANTDTKLLICGLFQKGRVLAQDGVGGGVGDSSSPYAQGNTVQQGDARFPTETWASGQSQTIVKPTALLWARSQTQTIGKPHE